MADGGMAGGKLADGGLAGDGLADGKLTHSRLAGGRNGIAIPPERVIILLAS